jgi:hypothetical protein
MTTCCTCYRFSHAIAGAFLVAANTWNNTHTHSNPHALVAHGAIHMRTTTTGARLLAARRHAATVRRVRGHQRAPQASLSHTPLAIYCSAAPACRPGLSERVLKHSTYPSSPHTSNMSHNDTMEILLRCMCIVPAQLWRLSGQSTPPASARCSASASCGRQAT